MRFTILMEGIDVTVRYRATLDMGVRTTQSPPLVIWKALFSAGHPMSAEEIAAATGLKLKTVQLVVNDLFYGQYGILTEEAWEAAHPPKPEPEETPEEAATEGEAVQAVPEPTE